MTNKWSVNENITFIKDRNYIVLDISPDVDSYIELITRYSFNALHFRDALLSGQPLVQKDLTVERHNKAL